jgi:hypothetical protein
MSLDEIIETLPKLSAKERRELGRRLLELETDEDIAICDYLAAEGFARLNQMEREDKLKSAKNSKARRGLAR